MDKHRWAFIHPFQLRMQRGIEVYLWNLASALAEMGIGVDILTWDGPLPVPDYAQKVGIRVRRVPNARYYQAWMGVPFYVKWLLQGNYRHAFLNFAGYGEGMALCLARRFKPIPFSMVFHFPRSLVPHRYYEFERWKFQTNAEQLIAVSQATAKEVEQWSKRKCLVIGHGVDTQRFRPDAGLRSKTRRELVIGEEEKILISVAALEERKGIQWVIRVMPLLIESYPRLDYWIIGEGSYRVKLKEMVTALNLCENVRFFGFKQDIPPFLAASDIALLLSNGEGSPISLLEYAAAGLPVITSTFPPFPELVQHGWGIMLDRENTIEIAQAIMELLKNPDRMATMGATGRADMKQNYSWMAVAKQYIELIG
jgi:glycosyltransferase involved in cell wall biosynthesis